LIALTIQPGAVLSGTGTIVGPVTNGGQISPGQPFGTVGIQGGYTQNAGADLLLALGGTAAGQYDQLTSTGPVTLGGNLDLALASGFTPQPGDSFLILENAGTGAVSGSFAGLPEGTTWAVGPNVYQISYRGGDGNDVAVTYVDTVPTGLSATPSASSVEAGNTFTVSGSFNDPDLAQAHTVTINWGDGSSNSTINLAAGVFNYNAGHVYTASSFNQPQASNAVTVTVGDPLGYSASAAAVLVAVRGPYAVTTTADSGPGSLRDAINQINADTGHTLFPSPTDPTRDEIDFAIPTTDPGYSNSARTFTIQPATPLPAITNGAIINGATQPGSTLNPPANVTLVIVGSSPAFTVTGGNVIVRNVTFTTATDAPTILVTGGSLTLRNDVVQESTGFTDAAVSVTGGTLDLGTASDPGGNTLNINGTGRFADNATSNQIPALGDTFEINGAQVTPAPYVVTTTAASGPGSLADAIAQVNGDSLHVIYTSPTDPTRDEIDFNIAGLSSSNPGTITLAGSELLVSNSVIINGPGAGSLAVSGNGQSRVFEFTNGANDTLSGLTIEDGDATLGNMVDFGGEPFPLWLQAQHAQADGGGGILNFGATLTVSGCTLSQNSANSVGGGIFNASGAMTVADCTLSRNSSGSFPFLFGAPNADYGGGGIANALGQMTVSGCTLDDNFDTGGGNGGGILDYDGGPLTVSGCTLIGNSASNGGGIYIWGSAAAVTTISSSTFAGNGAYSGGGLFNESGQVIVSGCTLSGNNASSSGGGIYDSGGTLTIENASAATVYGTQTFDVNSGVYGNLAPTGADLENQRGVLNINHTAVGTVDNQNPAATTVAAAATDTATLLSAVLNPAVLTGQLVINVQVLAVQPGAVRPTGTVTLYDANNNVLGAATLSNGQANFTLPSIMGSPVPIRAVYQGDANFSGSTSAPLQAPLAEAQDRILTPAITSSLPTDAAGHPTVPQGDMTFLNGAVQEPTYVINPVARSWSVTGGPYSGGPDGSGFDVTPQGNGVYVVTLDVTDPDCRAGSVSYTIDVTPAVSFSRTKTSPSPVLLDPTFGTGGIQLKSLGSPDNEAIAVFAQPDGKLLVVGLTQNLPNGGYSLTLSRYEVNGSLDPTYGSGGTVITDLTSPNYFYPLPHNQFVCQPDGSLVILWMTKDANGNVLSTQVTRYLPDGSLDTGFGTNGVVAVTNFTANVIAGQTDGKILIGGYVVVGTDVNGNAVVDSVVERLNAKGTPDTGFGAAGTGEVVQDLGRTDTFTLDQSYVDSLAVQPDGTILVGGYVVLGTALRVDCAFVAGFHANGGLDASFGIGGEVVFVNTAIFGVPQQVSPSAVAFYNPYVLDTATTALTLQPDGHILVGMGTNSNRFLNNPSSEQFSEAFFLRLNGDATLDSGFGQQINGSTGLLIRSVVQWTVDAAGNILVFYPTTPPLDADGNHEFAVTRYTAGGVPDPTFGSDGMGNAIIDVTGADSFAQGVAVQRDGNIVLVGTQSADNDQTWQIELMRVIGQAGPANNGPPGVPLTLYPVLPQVNGQPQSFVYTWNVAKNGAAFTSSSSAVLATVPSFTFTPDTNGIYVATLTVTDAAGLSASASSTFLVDEPSTGATPNQVNLPLFAWDASPANQQAGFTYTINWGDGTPQAPDLQMLPQTAGNGSGLSASHAFTASGSYLVTVIATDQYGVSQATSDVVVVGTAGADALAFSGGPNPGDVQVNLNGVSHIFLPTGQVFATGLGGGDTYTVNFGSTLTTPIILAGGGSPSGDSLVINGDNSNTNVINKTTGQITWGSPVTEMVFRSGIPSTTINANGTTSNYITDPGANTTINGGPGANFITITASSGSGVAINGGPTSNTYVVDLGSLAGPVSIANSHAGASDTLTVNGAPGDNTIAIGGTQVTEGTQTITETAPLTNLTVNGGSGNNQFTVSALTVPVQGLTLNGGGTSNTFNLNNIDNSVQSLTINGGSSAAGATQVHVQGALPASVTGQNASPIVSAPTGATLNEGSTFTGFGSFIDPNAGQTFTATVDYGDGSGPQPLTLAANDTFTLSHVYADEGSYPVTVSVTGSTDGTGTASFTITVNNVPPTGSLAAPADGFHGVDGQTRTFGIGATDPSTVDQAAGFTYVINWGDGTSSNPDLQTIAASPNNGSGLTVGHVFPAAGSYTISVTAADQDGATDAAATLAVNIQAFEQQGTTLTVGGSSANDAYVFTPGSSSGTVVVKDNSTSLGTFTTALVQVYGGAGMNTITVNGLTTGTAFTITAAPRSPSPACPYPATASRVGPSTAGPGPTPLPLAAAACTPP
jgi:uncharacterized delta-60 repeat protein